MVLDIKGNFDVQILKRDLSLIGRTHHLLYITIMSPHHCWICFEEGVVATDDITNAWNCCCWFGTGRKANNESGEPLVRYCSCRGSSVSSDVCSSLCICLIVYDMCGDILYYIYIYMMFRCSYVGMSYNDPLTLCDDD